MTRSWIRGALMIAAVVAGCSKADPPSGPSATDPPLTVTITNNVASPRTLTVPPGSQITFVNRDTVTHEMYSDPHPEHTDCPEFDSVGRLAPGQRRQTTNLVVVRTCNFHDHINPFINTLTGSIRVQ